MFALGQISLGKSVKPPICSMYLPTSSVSHHKLIIRKIQDKFIKHNQYAGDSDGLLTTTRKATLTPNTNPAQIIPEYNLT